MPPNGHSGLPPAWIHQAHIGLSYIIDSEIRPLSAKWGEKPHAVNSAPVVSFAKRLVQAKAKKLSPNWFHYLKIMIMLQVSVVCTARKVKTKPSQRMEILPDPDMTMHLLFLLVSPRYKAVQDRMPLKVVCSRWHLPNSDIYWGPVLQGTGKEQSAQTWLIRAFEMTQCRTQFWIRR